MFLFFCLRVFYILEEERVLNDNAITTVACYWRWLHGCVHGLVTTQGFSDWLLMGEMEWWNNTFLEASKCRGQSGGSTNLR